MRTIRIRKEKGGPWVPTEFIEFVAGFVKVDDGQGPLNVLEEHCNEADLLALFDERQARADEEAELEAIRQALIEETDISARASARPAKHCPICGGPGHVWSGTGYPKLVCADCGQTIDDDYGGHLAYELDKK